jgi:hypothetical protein
LLLGPAAPYVRYAADRLGRVHVLTTEQHPRAVPTSVYHGVIVDSRLLRSDGTVVDADLFDDAAVYPNRLTRVFGAGGGLRAWTIDLQVDDEGRPYVAFSVHGRRNEYWFARFDGKRWRVHFLAHAGSALYGGEAYYTGLVALDPHDPGRVVVSTDVHPETGVPLISAADGQQHHELFEGISTDGGVTWQWVTITADSTADNLRPIIPIWDGDQRALLWLRGVYISYTNYDLDVVATITERPTITPDAAAATNEAAAARAVVENPSRSVARRRWRRRC